MCCANTRRNITIAAKKPEPFFALRKNIKGCPTGRPFLFGAERRSCQQRLGVLYRQHTQGVRRVVAMKFERFWKGMAPIVMMGIGLGLAGCDNVSVNVGDDKGVPLAELDLSGPAPTGIALGSGDTVILTEGDTLAITIEGDDKAKEDLRFFRDKETLGIGRKSGLMGNKGGTPATIRVTMAAPKELIIGGSGTILAQRLAANAELAMGGSGTITFTEFAGDTLQISIGGSGKVKGAGTAKRLQVNIGGKGDVDLAGLKTERGEVSIGGSGDVAFASDGTVEASIAGSGTVKVTGRAKCTANSFGSGKLICEPAAEDIATPAEASAE
jgi:hypothetical protein